ncbi:MAG: hypothetical protein DHS20C06_09970 [Hyphobacterium sp.]|nr:MAG: hypothetical protein DHS20C06_09970 [Hyphobacterium sp.]
MIGTETILNEKEAQKAKAELSELSHALSTHSTFDSLVAGLPVTAIDGVRKALVSEKVELDSMLIAYEEAKSGNYADLKKRAGNDPGLALIVARIARGFTQKHLARKLGLKEQQIQRYEADRYRTISIANFRRVASVLGLSWELNLADHWFGAQDNISAEFSADEVKKILKHARKNAWFDGDLSTSAETEESFNYLQRYVSDHLIKYGSPSLLRTGLNVQDRSNDLALMAWRARVTRRAEVIIQANSVDYRPLDVRWLLELVKLSAASNGPLLAQEMLLEKGIVLIVEPQIPGMSVDGSAFLIEGVPIIGLTIRRDTVDNFWFTLLHEIGHVVLHNRSGLATGFFDDTKNQSLDEIELEADQFASNLLVPDEVWRRSPVRITKSSNVIEKFATKVGVHPAIVFGRLQKERNDYKTFANKIGRGKIRPLFLDERE